jgi:hypothetical protein
VKKTYLSIAAAAVISFAGATAGIAAELPTYEANGFPISPVQVGVLGAANVREQSPVTISPASAQRPGVLKAAAMAPARTTGLSTR